VLFYYDNKRVWIDRQIGKLVEEAGCDPRDYFEYCNENTVSLSFNGSLLYEILNSYAGTLGQMGWWHFSFNVNRSKWSS
jgi:hypothetical protein